MRRRYLLLFPLALVLLVAPAAFAVYDAAWAHDWTKSPRFDGHAYLLSRGGFVQQDVDPTGVSAVIATLARWSGEALTEAQVFEELGGRSASGYRLSDVTNVASHHGLRGRWLEAEAGALDDLKVPYVAHLSDRGNRSVIVRDVRSGYVYATDPRRGNVLYPHDAFDAAWTGRAFVFPDPPPQPESWR